MNPGVLAEERWTNARYRVFFFFDQRAAAARRAWARRASADTPSQRALPPFGPPFLPPSRPSARSASRMAGSSLRRDATARDSSTSAQSLDQLVGLLA